MSANTKIEWADHTFNPWIGCTKVGPGCDNCYAKADFDDRKHRVTWGAGQARSRTKTWGNPVRWNKQHLSFGIKHGRRQRVFCASLADVFDNEVPDAWRLDLFRLIRATPNLDWLMLTKRIGNAPIMLANVRLQADEYLDPFPWPNVWIGATIVNQEEADRDIPKLLAIPAAQRFLSMEPLLGPVDLGLCDCDKGSRAGPGGVGGVTCPRCHGAGGRMMDWVIVGGESGPNARPMHPDWVRSLRDQCQEASVPFLFKQWGEWVSVELDMNPSDADEMKHFEHQVSRIGKKAAGRLLDGREHNGVPS